MLDHRQTGKQLKSSVKGLMLGQSRGKTLAPVSEGQRRLPGAGDILAKMRRGRSEPGRRPRLEMMFKEPSKYRTWSGCAE